VFTPFIREGMENHNEWEKRFYAEADALRNPSKTLIRDGG
jgi:beta-hydroxylase